jgi:hypothetical protein
MNGFTTGSRYLNGQIPKSLPPAKPGMFSECDDCQDLDECKLAVADAMGTCRFVACHRQSEVFAKYRNAHLTGDPVAIKMVAADNQARMQLVLNALFKSIHNYGVVIERPMMNGFGVAIKVDGKVITTLQSNPATNDMIKLAEKMGFSLTDWTLTPKSREAKAAFEGYLAGQAAERGVSMDEFIDKHNRDMTSFHDAIAKGGQLAAQDETLREAETEEKASEA